MVTQTVQDRFWEKVAITPSCWLWMGSKTLGGYGHVGLNGKYPLAHRLSYEWAIGPIPEGFQIDHLCRVRNCVNPKHLEAVTQQENIRRGDGGSFNREKTHCNNGHIYDAVNTYLKNDGGRQCLPCQRIYDAKRYQARKNSGYGVEV